MKKKYIFSLLILLFTLFITNHTQATIQINNYVIDAELKENGDMNVEETITYQSNEYKNGISRNILIKNESNLLNSADSIKLNSIKVNGESYTKVSHANIGQDGVYTYEIKNNSHNFKVYTPFKINTYNRSVEKTVKFNYTLNNVGVVYEDTAELFWNFVGKEWDMNINKLEINIVLPQKSTRDKIYVFGHGSDNGTFAKNDNYITLKVNNIKPGQAIDARILFSKEALNYSNKTVNKNVLQKYIDQEEGLSKQRDAKKLFGIITAKELTQVFTIIILIMAVIIIFVKGRKNIKYKYYRELPADLQPTLLQYIYYDGMKNNTLWVTFLELIQKGVFSIKKTTNEVGKETYLIKHEKTDATLTAYQSKAEDIILRCIRVGKNSDDSISIDELKSIMKNDSKSLGAYNLYNSYKNKIVSKVEGLFGEKKPSKIKYITISIMVAFIIINCILATQGEQPEMSFILLMFLTITTIAYSTFFNKSIMNNIFTAIFMTIHFSMFQIGNIALMAQSGLGYMYIPYILLFILNCYALKLKKYSNEELEIKAQIKGLKNYIKDYSLLKDKETEYINLWEEYFIMAVALGVNNKTINYFYDMCIQHPNSNFSSSMLEIGSVSVMNTTFNNVFGKTINTSSHSSGSSYSGSSGGFSGGSSSGGGGRRRRGRKLLLN